MTTSSRHFPLLRAGAISAVTLLGLGTAAARVPSSHGGRTATAVFAAGCYWGVESVFEHAKGVKDVVSGFAVPGAPAPGWAALRETSYAEAVTIRYDPDRISYHQLLELLFVVAHDPTQVDRQGPDVGAEYRSVIFTSDTMEKREAEAMIDSLKTAKAYNRPIVTEIATLKAFKTAPDEHQDYVVKNPDARYVVVNDRPKLEQFRRKYPALYH